MLDRHQVNKSIKKKKEYIPWNRFLGSLKVSKYRLRSWRKGKMKIGDIETAECDHRYRYLHRQGQERRLKIRWTQSRGNISYMCSKLSRVPTPQKQSPNFKTFIEHKHRFQGINSAIRCSLAGRYVNPIPTRFLDPPQIV